MLKDIVIIVHGEKHTEFFPITDLPVPQTRLFNVFFLALIFDKRKEEIVHFSASIIKLIMTHQKTKYKHIVGIKLWWFKLACEKGSLLWTRWVNVVFPSCWFISSMAAPYARFASFSWWNRSLEEVELFGDENVIMHIKKNY
jgi:hypothetical protein